MLHARVPCTSCPFRLERPGSFPPEALDATVGANLRSGVHVHKCHSTLGKPLERLCVGYIRHVLDGEHDCQNLRIGIAMGLIDPDALDTSVPIHNDFGELLADHAEQLAELDE